MPASLSFVGLAATGSSKQSAQTIARTQIVAPALVNFWIVTPGTVRTWTLRDNPIGAAITADSTRFSSGAAGRKVEESGRNADVATSVLMKAGSMCQGVTPGSQLPLALSQRSSRNCGDH